MILEIITNPNFVSAFSLILSILVFYYTYLKPPQIKLYIGENINVWHLKNSIAIDLQLLYINSSFRPGVISKIELLVYTKDDKLHLHKIEWKNFLTLIKNDNPDVNAKKTWDDHPVYPFSTSNKNDELKFVSFVSKDQIIDWTPEPNSYKLSIVTHYSKKFLKHKKHTNIFFTITEDIYKEIKKKKNEQKQISTYVRSFR